MSKLEVTHKLTPRSTPFHKLNSGDLFRDPSLPGMVLMKLITTNSHEQRLSVILNGPNAGVPTPYVAFYEVFEVQGTLTTKDV